MASFSSALAVFILVLFNGCFTLPVDVYDSTQQNTLGLQFTSNTETNENMGFDVSTPFVTSSNNGKQEQIDSVSTPMEESSTYIAQYPVNGKQILEDSFSTPMESSTYPVKSVGNDKREFEDSFSTPMESEDNDKREYNDDLLLSTTGLNLGITDFDRQDVTNNLQGESDRENSPKRETKIESTINDMFLSTSTNVVQKPPTSQSLISPSKGKYTGLLQLDNNNQEEQVPDQQQELEPEAATTRPFNNFKLFRQVQAKSELRSIDQIPSDTGVEQSSTESTPRTAIYDQKPLDSFAPNLSGVMILDDNNTMVVTDIPSLLSTSTKTIEKQEVPLNQGKESLYTEKKEQNN
jgi:hypothetical protein